MADPTVLTGYRDMGTAYNDKQNIVDMKDTIYELNPRLYPLTALVGRLRKVETIQPKFEWMEDGKMPFWDAINAGAGYSAVATDFVVDTINLFDVGGTIVFPRTGEVARVTVVTIGTSTITVARGTGAAAIQDNEILMIVADGNEEGALSRESKQTVLANLWNYTQIFRTPVSITRTAKVSKMIGGNELDRQRNKMAIFHQEKIERAFWFGKRAIITTGYHPLRYTGGVFEFVTTNITHFGGMMTEYDLNGYLESAMAYGAANKVTFMGSRVVSVINGFAMDKLYVVDQAKKEFGLNIIKYISPHGDLQMVEHPMFTGDVYGYMMVTLDLSDDCIEYRYLTDSDTQLHQNIQANDLDGQKDEYLTECGLMIANEQNHAIGLDIRS